jgi:hypothetical protein
MGAQGIASLATNGASRGAYLFDSDTEVDRNAVDGYVDTLGAAHFLTLKPEVVTWDGTGVTDVSGTLPPLAEEANVWTRSSGAIGLTAFGTEWLIRALRTADGAHVVWRERHLDQGDDGVDVPITATDGVAVLPVAAVDASGRVHVVWYDTTAARGVLRYTHSVSSQLDDGFLPSIVVDDDACPGNRWYPYSADPRLPDGGRRLREYIGIAISGTRAHVAWTHAPIAPSRVRTTYIDFD